jgi:VanZ family protein
MVMVENQDSSRLKKAALILLVGYWLALFVSTHIPSPPHALVPRVSDKLLHFAGYAGLTFLVCLNWSLRRALAWRQWLGVLVLLAVLGAIDEVTQIPVGRQCDFLDWIADVIGIAAGLASFGVASALNCLPALRPRRA